MDQDEEAAAVAEQEENEEENVEESPARRAVCGERYTRAMIDALKLRVCPLSEIKLANPAGDRPFRTLLAMAAAGCVVRRTPTRCPIFFTRSLPRPPTTLFSGKSFWIPAIGERE